MTLSATFSKRTRLRSLIPLALCLLTLSLAPLHAQTLKPEQQPPATVQPVPQVPVTINGRALFPVRGLLSFSAQTRANVISERIHDLSKDVSFDPNAITVSEATTTSDIVAGDRILMSVTDLDVAIPGESRHNLALDYAHRITIALILLRKEYSARSLLLGCAYALAATIVLLILLRIFSTLFPRFYSKLDTSRDTIIPSLHIQKFELLPSTRIADILIGLVRLLRLALTVTLLYFYISLDLGFFPWTRDYAHLLIGYILAPLRLVGTAIIAYLPNLFFIAVIALVAVYLIKLLRVIFTEMGKQTISFSGFHSEWAEPTYKIARFLVLTLTAIAIFPYLPGAKSPAFQGISIFLGVLFSLGSSSAVANIVAGVILTYMRAFKVGDRVQMSDTIGDVIECSLLVTRLRTIKNVEVTIANSMVLSSHIVNFSASAQQRGLILHTTVTIGYDAPWRIVHQLLLAAAAATENVLTDPKPFILQTALDDFYVHYELNAFTNIPNHTARIYSDLHQNIQDKFNEAGVEIMSPHYATMRDGNRIAIPDQYLPKGYVTPSFRVGLAPNPTKNPTPES